MLDNTPDFGMGRQPTIDPVAPPIDTHWSRILYYDLSKGEVEPWAQHALAANGCGGIAITDTASSAQLTSFQPQQTARADRSLTLGELIVAAIQAAAASVRRAYARYGQRREIDAIYDALRQLGDRTLRDLGFHRSELGVDRGAIDARRRGHPHTDVAQFSERSPSVTPPEIANSTIDPQEQNEEITMHRYETPTPRVAFGITAVAMTAITIGVLVVMPARCTRRV